MKETSVTLTTRQLLSKMDKTGAKNIVWFVQGMYPKEKGQVSKLPIDSNRYRIDKEGGGYGPLLKILFTVFALFFAVILIVKKGIPAFTRYTAQKKTKMDSSRSSDKKNDDKKEDKQSGQTSSKIGGWD